MHKEYTHKVHPVSCDLPSIASIPCLLACVAKPNRGAMEREEKQVSTHTNKDLVTKFAPIFARTVMF